MAHVDGPATGPPSDPWPTSPLYPVSGPILPPSRQRPRWLVLVAAGTAALAAIIFTAVACWPRSGGASTSPLAFRPVTEAGTVTFAEDGQPQFTQLVGDRTVVAATVGIDLELVAVDLATGEERWRNRLAGLEGRRWLYLAATPQLVVVRTDLTSTAEPRPLIALDAETGQERWRQNVFGNDPVFIRGEVVAVADEKQRQLVGLDPGTGERSWRIDYPGGERAAVVPLFGADDLAGPSRLDGTPQDRGQTRVALVGSDRSVRVVDLTNGAIEWHRTNVAHPRDWLLAYEDQLFVAEYEAGYRVLSYDLTDEAGLPRTIFAVDDPDRWVGSGLQLCGTDRVCLLDQAGSDPETTELVMLDAAGATGMMWRRSVSPGGLLPVGELVVINGQGPVATGYDRDGELVFQRGGFAVRLNLGNLLLFGEEPLSLRRDLSLVGYSIEADGFVGLDVARGVAGEGCSWGGVYLVCPGWEQAVGWQFADE